MATPRYWIPAASQEDFPRQPSSRLISGVTVTVAVAAGTDRLFFQSCTAGESRFFHTEGNLILQDPNVPEQEYAARIQG